VGEQHFSTDPISNVSEAVCASGMGDIPY